MTRPKLSPRHQAYVERKHARTCEEFNVPLTMTAGKASRKRMAERIKELCEKNGQDPTANITPDDLKKFLTLTYAEMHAYTMISSGENVRNANAILRAIEGKLGLTVPKAQGAQDTQSVTVTIQALGEPTVTSTTADAPKKDLPC